MIKLKKYYTILLLTLFLGKLMGQNSYLEKTVILPTGQTNVKAVLNSLSKQSGCVFAYDPTKLNDKTPLNISVKGSCSLQSALNQILPNGTQCQPNGKYIVLQKKTLKNATQPKPIVKVKLEGKISANESKERLVLPPLATNVYPSAKIPPTEFAPALRDSVAVVQPAMEVPPTNVKTETSTPILQVVPKEVSPKSISILDTTLVQTKNDTLKQTASSIGTFMRQNGFLESALSLNRRLGAVSLRAGLYNIYSILSIGSDYNKSYHLGIGIGYNVKINKSWGLNIDVMNNTLIAGKSYKLGVRATTVELSPTVNYALNSTIKLFVGPTLYSVTSRYKNGTSVDTNLGKLSVIRLSVGLKLDLNSHTQRK